MPAFAETGNSNGALFEINESLVVLELTEERTELRDVVVPELIEEYIELSDPDVVGLEDCEEDEIAVTASSEKRFVVFLQQTFDV